MRLGWFGLNTIRREGEETEAVRAIIKTNVEGKRGTRRGTPTKEDVDGIMETIENYTRAVSVLCMCVCVCVGRGCE